MIYQIIASILPNGLQDLNNHNDDNNNNNNNNRLVLPKDAHISYSTKPIKNQNKIKVSGLSLLLGSTQYMLEG